MKKEATKTYAKREHYEKAHAYFTAQGNERALKNAHSYAHLLATQGIEVNIYDCKEWLASLETVGDCSGFTLD